MAAAAQSVQPQIKTSRNNTRGVGTLTLQKHFQLFAQVFKFKHKCQECVNIGSEGGGQQKVLIFLGHGCGVLCCTDLWWSPTYITLLYGDHPN